MTWRKSVANVLRKFALTLDNLAFRIEKPWADREIRRSGL